jgi:hypothetical protein
VNKDEFIREAAKRLRILKKKHEPLPDKRIDELALSLTRIGMTNIPHLSDDDIRSLVMEVYDRRSAGSFVRKVCSEWGLTFELKEC